LQSDARPRPWQSLSIEDAGTALSTDLTRGLASEEAKRRLEVAGPNRIGVDKPEPLWREFLDEAREPIILLLFVTGVFYGVIGGIVDALVIVAVIVTLVSVEVLNEHRAGGAIRSLRKLAEPTVPVFRDGSYAQLLLEEVVPGDLISLESGRRVPADARVVESYSILVDEASLTGESVPVEKEAGMTLKEDTPLAERTNVVYAGGTVLRGRGRAVVFATGEATELGRAARLARDVEVPRTLLQATMGELSKWMVVVAIAFSVVIPLLGILLVHESVTQMVLTGLTLAFATIPEELPIIVTMVLALGAYRLSKERAVIRDLQAVETLGAVTVIASDKTGTLTENRVELKKIFPEGNKRRIHEIGVLATETPDDPGQLPGDPLERAMRSSAPGGGGSRAALGDLSRRDLFTFDNTRKIMSVVYDSGKGLWVGAKGAPEALLARSTRELGPGGEHLLVDTDRDAILTAANRMAAEGLRVVGFAEKTILKDRAAQDEAEYDLTFVGLAGFADAVRPEVKGAVASCVAAGIRPVMITGTIR
jgi:Ca2+-transporting ATPase